MKAIKIPFSFKLLIPFIVALAILTLIMPRKGVFKYSYQKGGTWNYETLAAPFDFPILKTQDEINSEKQSRLSMSYTSYYDYGVEVKGDVTAAISEILPDSLGLTGPVLEYLQPRYDVGILSDKKDYSVALSSVTENPHTVFVKKGKSAAMTPYSDLYTLQSVRKGLVEIIAAANPDIDVEELCEQYGLLNMVRPNLFFDKALTESKFKAVSNPDDVAVTLGTFPAGSIIVHSGDVISSSTLRLLDSFKAEFDTNIGYNGPVFRIWLGNFLISLILVTLLMLFLLMSNQKMLKTINWYLFVLTLFLLSCAVTFIMLNYRTSMFYLIPYPVFALYLVSFFDKKIVMPTYLVFLLPVLLFCDEGMKLFVNFLLTGGVAVVAFSRLNKGWHQFVSALVVFGSLFTVSLCLTILEGSEFAINWENTLYMLLGSLFMILAYPLVFLFEKIFNLISESRLVDLTDTNSKLLLELSQKAPGTFQHCIAVMNMVDAVGKELDVDLPLLRAGALYHDIGKMLNPSCFVENQISGVDFHKGMQPKESAKNIISHVNDGVALAEKHNLPKVIVNFIKTHHGTTSAAYFHTMYLNDGGNPDDVADFYYPGPKPTTKEQVILMFCDTIDAASRTIDKFDYDTVSVFVDKIYDGKFSAGQFDDSDITLQELKVLKEAVKQYLVQLHHGRVAYPDRKS